MNSPMNIFAKNRIKITFILPTILVLFFLALSSTSVLAASYATPGSVTASINAKDGTVLRSKASTSSAKVRNLSNNSKITIYYEVYTHKTSTSSSYHWYRVGIGKSKGYVMARRVDGIKYNAVLGKLTQKVPARKGPGSSFQSAGNLAQNKQVSVFMKSRYKGSSQWWMKIKVGNKYRYVLANRLAKVSTSSFEAYLTKQGFPASYKKKLRKLHNEHPNWVFKAQKVNITFNTVLSRETRNGVSLINKTYPKSYRDKSSYSYKNGKYIAKDGSSWFNANKKVVAYYMDPRHFLNNTRIYMYLSLNYHSYQTTATVNKVLSGTMLPKKGFTASMFCKAGKKYKVSPIFLASRAKQETGGGSIAINGYKYKGKTVYNPFNIGAGSGSNPVMNGLKYAYKKGWTTRNKAVNGAADILQNSYIGKKQNTIYYQRFNIKNGWLKAGTHQYMTNIMAPYFESASMKKTYETYGLTDEKLVFEIPVYKSMPSSTSLPK